MQTKRKFNQKREKNRKAEIEDLKDIVQPENRGSMMVPNLI
jgi:hypothetical protein